MILKFLVKDYSINFGTLSHGLLRGAPSFAVFQTAREQGLFWPCRWKPQQDLEFSGRERLPL